jgi:hypothetical protein
MTPSESIGILTTGAFQPDFPLGAPKGDVVIPTNGSGMAIMSVRDTSPAVKIITEYEAECGNGARLVYRITVDPKAKDQKLDADCMMPSAPVPDGFVAARESAK